MRSLDDADLPEVESDAWTCHFTGHEPDSWREMQGCDEFDYGYALTVHKAQGSQWDSVALVDEWSQANRRQWLYTGITRAARRVTVIRG